MLPERKNSGQRRIMTDSDFLELFNKRDEAAINAVAGQYGAYLRTIALNILGDEGESEECVNDALFSVWNRVPPEQPRNIRAYIAAAVRNAALDRYKQKHRLKRIPSEYTTSLVLIWENKTDSVFSYAARDVDVNGVRVLPGYIIYDEDFFFADTSPGVRTTGVYIFNIDLDFQLRFDQKELADQADFSKYRTIRFDLDVVEELNYDQMTLLETYQVFIDLDSIPLKVSDQFPSMR